MQAFSDPSLFAAFYQEFQVPELPEVETTRRGIEPHIRHRTITRVIVRQPRLRWPVTPGLEQALAGQQIRQVRRRAKYLLVETGSGTLVIHLGMSGSLRILKQPQPPQKHDHIDIQLDSGDVLRYTDPRRFGAMLWLTEDPAEHPLLRELGPEPLDEVLSGDYLFEKSRGRSIAIKSFIMDSHVVVGVGNIYANEALFLSGIHPQRAAGRISLQRYQALAEQIKRVLARSIEQGGTTLRDFVGGDGKPGYFQQTLQVYGRGGKPCRACGETLKEIRQGQRSTVYCGQCQR